MATNRVFDLHVGVDHNTVTGDIDYQISGKITKEAKDTFLGGFVINMVEALDKQRRASELSLASKPVIDVVETISPEKALEDKWKKK